MATVESAVVANGEATPVIEEDASPVTALLSSLALIEKSATTFDPRYVLKVFRELGPLRRKLTAETLLHVIKQRYPEDHPHQTSLVSAVESFVEDDSMDTTEETTGSAVTPEVDMFVHLLVQVYLHDKKEWTKLNQFNELVIVALKSYNRRTLDFISAKIWFYISRAREVSGDYVSVRSPLLMALRTATLRHDTETRASTITLLMRNYLLANDINQAFNLVEKVEFPENAGNSLVARYFYYLARIQAVQLDYSAAHDSALTAIRKTPQSTFAGGFLQAATKLNILIELLMGDIPELSYFREPTLEKSLIPYLAVTRAVRLGDLTLFAKTLESFGESLKKDNNYNLVLRLRQNVIKTGIRIISLSYKKISLKDVCIKLHLDSELSAEYIVAKAIRDGVIEATIDHENGFMQSNELLDVYSTREPQDEFDRRIKFCMSLHNDSVKAMRYPMSTNRIDLKADIEAREREQELLSFLQDGDFNDLL
ncbi:unnamed protein product [Kuraishia capsulata CBS 1993]|uniref:PCI domain-containing protein n=1 Tax=Kuraishia capsulata CBS 1993 TaxID=1382522 RepID=W6MI63_9ASCO|nr:uncharacterized protein KUCA_T00001523001 [Kuraishia capsulata CBS 1993]CDK25553.1 unnamed protein product [Kuraishia capsulata CBS 1993]